MKKTLTPKVDRDINIFPPEEFPISFFMLGIVENTKLFALGNACDV
jgi:hypothetical protein